MTQQRACAIAVDFGATSIKMGVTQGEHIVTQIESLPTDRFASPTAILNAIIEQARQLKAQYPAVKVTGLGMPGWCDYDKGVLYQLTNVPCWDKEVPVKNILQQALDLPVVLDNDGNCMAYAEWRFGAGLGLHNMVCLTLGTGLGGGIIVHDRLIRGARVSAAELGQTSINYRGKAGPFGNRGAIEEYIGNNELAAEAVQRYARMGIIKTRSECTPKRLEQAARSGCNVALQLWRDMAEKLACLIMNLCYTLVPQAFIIGGGVAKAGDLLFAPLLEYLHEQLFHVHWRDLQILPARFGPQAGLIGAGAMALDEWAGKDVLHPESGN